MRPQFREDKATQLACLFLRERGGTMSYLKLIKLMYLTDRRALLGWGRPVTFDRFVAMDNGPVLSRVLDLLREQPQEEFTWHQFIKQTQDYSVTLATEADCPSDALSEAERDLALSIFEEFRDHDRWAMVKHTHDLPEWYHPQGSSIPIEVGDVLRREGKTEVEIAAIEDELESLAFANFVLS